MCGTQKTRCASITEASYKLHCNPETESDTWNIMIILQTIRLIYFHHKLKVKFCLCFQEKEYY